MHAVHPQHGARRRDGDGEGIARRGTPEQVTDHDPVLSRFGGNKNSTAAKLIQLAEELYTFGRTKTGVWSRV